MRQEWRPARAVTNRGFAYALFDDAYGQRCIVKASSVIGDYDDGLDRPGTSALWVGLDGGPVPLSTRMHLSREQVKGLIRMLDRWLDRGEIEVPAESQTDSGEA